MSFHLCNKAHASQVRLCFFFFFLYTSYAEHGIHFCTNKREFSLRDQTGGETRERRKPHAGKHAPTDTLKSEKALATRRRHISPHLCKQGACWDCFGKRESHLTEKKKSLSSSLWFSFALFYDSGVIYPSERDRQADIQRERERQRERELPTLGTTLWFSGVNLILFALCKKAAPASTSVDFHWRQKHR